MSSRAGAGGGQSGAADQRRAQILQAAIDVSSKRGYADTRIADVAERSGVSPALVIYYFKTKDQVLTAAMRHYEDRWYEECQRRMAQLPSAAVRLEEIVAMSCLPEADPEPRSSWSRWLDFWVQAARNSEVASVRRMSDERWRKVITELVLAGQQAGEFREVDTGSFAVCLSSLLDGMAIQIALGDPVVDPVAAFELSMQFVADRLRFNWTPGRGRVTVSDRTARTGHSGAHPGALEDPSDWD